MTIRKMAVTTICLLCLFYLIGCKQEITGTDFSDTQEVHEGNGTSMMKMTDSKDGVLMDDLLESIDMLGKTATAIGIPVEAINSESALLNKTYIEGTIFETADYGVVYFDKLGPGREDYLVTDIWLHIKNVDYDECKRLLSETFGDPIEEGESPYVAVEGGAVKWAIYRLEDIDIRLSSASERDYTEITIEKPFDFE